MGNTIDFIQRRKELNLEKSVTTHDSDSVRIHNRKDNLIENNNVGLSEYEGEEIDFMFKLIFH